MEIDVMIIDLEADAREAARQSYSPYSHFPVGAAVLTRGGKVYRGCNVENASYGMTICAERVALFSALAAGERDFRAIAVACINGNPNQPSSLMPCGACRQVMAEFLASDTYVIVAGVRTFYLSELLPLPFEL